MNKHRINDIEFTLFSDGTVGIEVVGENDVISRAHLYTLANLSIRAQYEPLQDSLGDPVDDGSRFV